MWIQNSYIHLRVHGRPIGAEKVYPTAHMNLMKEPFKGKLKTEPVVEIALFLVSVALMQISYFSLTNELSE